VQASFGILEGVSESEPQGELINMDISYASVDADSSEHLQFLWELAWFS
jgi:hypothetical protein